MSPEALVAILRAHLESEGLVLCKKADTGFPLDGEAEMVALREIAVLTQDALDAAPPVLVIAVDELDDPASDNWDEKTTEVSDDALRMLRAKCAATAAEEART